MDPLADFQITIHDGRKPMVVQVVVHPTVADMRKEAQKHYNNWGGRKTQDNDLMEACGVCHRFHMADSPIYAVVRLAPPYIGAGIVAHELTHAAVWLWEIQHKFSKKVRLNCANDEWFCLVLGDLVRHTTNKLYEHGIYEN